MQRNQTSISTPLSRLKQSKHLPFSTTAATFRFIFGQFDRKQVYQGIFFLRKCGFMWFNSELRIDHSVFYIFVHLI